MYICKNLNLINFIIELNYRAYKNKIACVKYHTKMCEDYEDKTNEYVAPDGCLDNKDIVADFNPHPCDYSWQTCDLTTAAMSTLDFINSDKKDDCL
jgi:hypothetical protein